MARDRVVEQLCFRLGQAGFPASTVYSLLATRMDAAVKVAFCIIVHRRESSAETGVTPSWHGQTPFFLQSSMNDAKRY